MNLENSFSEETPQEGESSKLKKAINAAIVAVNIVGAGMAIPEEARAQDKLASVNIFSQPEAETKRTSAESSMSIEKLDQSVLSYIKGLGMFGKLGLINDIKEHGDEIKLFLRTGINDTEKTQALFKKSGTELKTVLSKYTQGLKQLDAPLRDATVSKISDLVSTVQNSSISELQDKFK